MCGFVRLWTIFTQIYYLFIFFLICHVKNGGHLIITHTVKDVIYGCVHESWRLWRKVTLCTGNSAVFPWTFSSPLVTLCTTRFIIKEFDILLTQCIYVLCGSQNKQQLSPYTALTDRCLYPRWRVVTMFYKQDL